MTATNDLAWLTVADASALLRTKKLSGRALECGGGLRERPVRGQDPPPPLPTAAAAKYRRPTSRR